MNVARITGASSWTHGNARRKTSGRSRAMLNTSPMASPTSKDAKRNGGYGAGLTGADRWGASPRLMQPSALAQKIVDLVIEIDDTSCDGPGILVASNS